MKTIYALAPAIDEQIRGSVQLTFSHIRDHPDLRDLVKERGGVRQTAHLAGLYLNYGSLFNWVRATLPWWRRRRIATFGVTEVTRTAPAFGDSIGLAAAAAFYAKAYDSDVDVIIATGAVEKNGDDLKIDLRCTTADLRGKIEEINNCICQTNAAFKSIGKSSLKCLILLPESREEEIRSMADNWRSATDSMNLMGGNLVVQYVGRGSDIIRYFAGGTGKSRSPLRVSLAVAALCVGILGVLTGIRHVPEPGGLGPDCPFCPPLVSVKNAGGGAIGTRPVSVGDLRAALQYQSLRDELERVRRDYDYIADQHCRSALLNRVDELATWEIDNSGNRRNDADAAPCLSWPEAAAVAKFAAKLSGKPYSLTTQAGWGAVVANKMEKLGYQEWLAGCRGEEPCGNRPSGTIDDATGGAVVDEFSYFTRSEFRLFRLMRGTGESK